MSIMNLIKLAKKFELKLKHAAEVGDSTQLHLAIQPKINTLLPQLREAMKNAILQSQSKNPELSGDLLVGKSFFTTARLQGGNWIVDPNGTKINAEGSFFNDPLVGPALQRAVRQFNNKAATIVNAELNRLKSNLQGDTITNHETAVSSFNLEV